jgi:hypothetical protein
MSRTPDGTSSHGPGVRPLGMSTWDSLGCVDRMFLGGVASPPSWSMSGFMMKVGREGQRLQCLRPNVGRKLML